MTEPHTSLPPPPVEDLPDMPITQHLEELRSVLFHVVGALLVGFLACWAFAPFRSIRCGSPAHGPPHSSRTQCAVAAAQRV